MKLFSVITLFLLFAANALNAQNMSKKISGQWESLQIEDLGNQTYGWRYFKFEGDKWEIQFTLYLDKEKQIPVFMFRGVGTYKIDEASQTVAGAKNATFYFDKKYVILLTNNADVIKGFGFDACMLEVGKEKDITESGCSFLPNKASYGQEFDLLALKGKKLYLGARPADGNMGTVDKRPTALGLPLQRKK
jgi:hypothetical protein